LGPAALAVYSAAMQIPTIKQRVFEATRPTLLGYVAAHHGSYEHQQVEAVRMLTAVLAVAATMFIALADPLMTFLYSRQYESGIMIMQALSVWMMFAILNYFYSVILIGKGQPRRAFFMTVPQLLIMLISSQILVPQYEGLGGAMALLITAFLGNLIAAKIIAGDDTMMWSALLMNMIRAAGPVVLFLAIVLQVKLSALSLVALSGGTLAGLSLLRVVTVADINAGRKLLSQIAGSLSTRPTTV
jgi:O-antigen/teichoic acid export membrane protein